MVDRISGNSDALQQAWAAARARRSSQASDLLQSARALQNEAAALQHGSRTAGTPPTTPDATAQHDFTAPASKSDSPFSSSLASSLRDVAQKVRATDELPADLVAGKIDNLPELAAQIKTADLSFRFALEVRNKLIDAYREVMRMSV